MRLEIPYAITPPLFPMRDHLKAWLQTQRDELGVEMTVKEAADFYAQAS
jgi:hypothetical protein